MSNREFNDLNNASHDELRIELEHKQKRIEALEKELELARQSAVNFETLLEALPDGFYLKDAKSRFILVNEATCRHFDLQNSAEIYGKTDHDFHPKEIADIYLKEEESVLRTGKPLIDERNIHIDKQGHEHIFLKSKYPCYDSSGYIIGILGINRDITELSEAQYQAEEKLTLLKSAINTMPDSFYIKDTEGRLLFINEKFCQLCGLDEKDILGKTDFDFPETKKAAEYREDEKLVIETGLPMVNKVESIEWEKGRKIWLMTTKMPYLNIQGHVVGIIGVTRDITDLKAAQQEGAQKLKLLQTLMEALPDMVCLKDINNRILFANKAYARRFNLSDARQILGKNDEDFHPKQEALSYQQEEQEIIRSGKPIINQANSYTDHEGKTHEILKSKIPCFDDEGRIMGILGINQDITEIRQSQKMSLERLKLLQTVINAIPDPIYLKDIHSRFILVNQALCTLFGKETPEDILGKTDFDFDFCGRADDFRNEEKQIMETCTPMINTKEWFISADGLQSCIIRTKIPYYDDQGKVIGILGINRDISVLDKAHSDLDQKLNLLQMLIDHLPDYIYVKDVKGHIVMANMASVRAGGYKKLEELIGKGDFDQFPSEEAKVFYEQEQKILEAGHAQSFLDECANKITGQKQIILSTKIPLKDNQGKVIGLVGIGRDMTDMKAQEQALIHAEKLASVGALAAGTAHQFNNLLAVIMATVDLSLTDKTLSASVVENLQNALTAAEKANVIVKDMLTFARQNKGRSDLGDVNEVVEQCLRMLNYEFEKENIQVHKDLSHVPPFLMDNDKLSHVTLNLLVNAKHALAARPEKKIRVETGVDKERAYIRITDNGCGIPQDQINAIFDPFYTTKGAYAQGETPQAKIAGTGLGLSVSHSIIQEHGGFINVSSHPDHGSVFTVWLPLQKSTSTSDSHRAEAANRILVVEDEPVVRKLMVQLISKEGYTVDQAGDGHEGLQRILNNKYSAILTDISMPRLGGVEMLQIAATKIPESQRPSFVVISGYIDDHYEELKKLGIHDILEKPFSNLQLIKVTDSAVKAFQNLSSPT